MATLYDGRPGHCDQDYQRWIAEHPDGYVVNTCRSQPANCHACRSKHGGQCTNAALHLAQCKAIRSYTLTKTEGCYTERDYLVKVCATSVEDLRDWIRRNGRGEGEFSSEHAQCVG